MAEIKATYVDHCGSDLSIVNAARVSFGKKSEKLKQKDKDLIKYLADNEHYSPFEHVTCTIVVECPLYIRSQIHRHRTFSYNEISRRYTSENIEFYIPPVDDIRMQSSDNKQASRGSLDHASADNAQYLIEELCRKAKQTYDELLELGVAREQARSVLPVCTMTKFYMSGNLRNWVHFLKLRLHPHAQKEARIVAEQVLAVLKEKFPEGVKALMASCGR